METRQASGRPGLRGQPGEGICYEVSGSRCRLRSVPVDPSKVGRRYVRLPHVRLPRAQSHSMVRKNVACRLPTPAERHRSFRFEDKSLAASFHDRRPSRSHRRFEPVCRGTIFSMPIEQILALLIAERDKLNQAIAALQGPKRRGRPLRNPLTVAAIASPEPTKRKLRKFSAAQREAAAERMRQRWTAKRKAEAKSARKPKKG